MVDDKMTNGSGTGDGAEPRADYTKQAVLPNHSENTRHKETVSKNTTRPNASIPYCILKYYYYLQIPFIKSKNPNYHIVRGSIINAIKNYGNIRSYAQAENKKIVYFQRHIGTTSFLTAVSQQIRNPYVFLKCKRNDSRADDKSFIYQPLLNFCKSNCEYNEESIKSFLMTCWKNLDKDKSCEQKTFIVDDFDIALINMFMDGEIELHQMQEMHQKWIQAAVKINSDEDSDMEIILSVHDNRASDSGEYVRLSKEWGQYFARDDADDKYNCFFKQVLKQVKLSIKNCPTESKRRDHEQGLQCNSNRKGCPYRVSAETFTNVNLSRIAIKNFKNLTLLNEDNPYWIMHTLIYASQSSDGYSCDDIDKNVKNIYMKDDSSGIIHKIFDEFLWALPFYLPSSYYDNPIGKDLFLQIKNVAAQWINKMVHNIFEYNNKGESFVCTNLARAELYADLTSDEQSFLYGRKNEIRNGIVKCFIDSGLLYFEEQISYCEARDKGLRDANNVYKSMPTEDLHTNDNVRIYRLHNFVKYIFSNQKIF